MKKVKKIQFLSCCFLLLLCSTNFPLQAQTIENPRLKEFNEMRFGMFVCWNVSSLRGTEMGWSRGRQVPISDYDSLYKEFNPVLFNADDWVRTAKDAGVKYLVFTAKHHDGFCFWPTKYTWYNIMATPYKKDIVGELNKACKKYGIEFGIYYSDLDWWHKDYPIRRPDDQTPDSRSDMNAYVKYMKNQLKELIDLYDPFLFWFDGQWEKPWTDSIGKDIYAYLKKLNPKLVINNRLGKEMAGDVNKKIDPANMVGDYDTPEQVVGRMNMVTPWESCFTICQQWSWKPNDKMKSLKECLNLISQTSGGNGNLLLSVGPMMDGRIELRQIERMKEIGNWMKTNGAAVYGTLGGPYPPDSNLATTRKGDKIFVHVINTNTGHITLKNVPGRSIKNAALINGKKINFTQNNASFSLALPADKKNKEEYIVVLEMDGNVEQIPVIL
ncbi:MAG: alpha-L-fucosidase [Bacteroidetes bacterium]|nr:alpha-L-fucosidase [Bacteroidota bacterium]MBS1610468.1 alpha-L-fucosidase [Bacteroidota bacterium]